MSERLRRWPAKPLHFVRVSSNLTVVDPFFLVVFFKRMNETTQYYQFIVSFFCELIAPLVSCLGNAVTHDGNAGACLFVFGVP